MPINQTVLKRLSENDPSLTELDLNDSLDDASLCDEDIHTLVSALTHNTHLTSLIIHGDGGKEKARFLLMYRDNKLYHKYPKGFITASSAILLANCRYIQVLDVSRNPIGDEGAIALSKSASLRELRVDCCEIGVDGAKAFLNNPILIELYAVGNPFGRSQYYDQDNWEEKIAKRLKDNKCLVDPIYAKERKIKEGNEAIEDAVLAAISRDDVASLRRLIPKLKDGVNTVLEHGVPPLKYAVDENKVEVADFLLRAGANLEQHSREYTPLFTAAQNGRYRMVRLLLSYGANITGEFYFDSQTARSIAAFKFCFHFLSTLKHVNSRAMNNRLDQEAEGTLQLKNRCLEFWGMIYYKGANHPTWKLFSSDHCLRFARDVKGVYCTYLELWKNRDQEYSLKQIGDTLEVSRPIWEDELQKIALDREIEKYAKIFEKLDGYTDIMAEKAPSSDADDTQTVIDEPLELVCAIEPCMEGTEDSQLTQTQLEKYVQQLNSELKEKTEKEVDWSKYPKFYIAQYRGIHYYRNHFTKQQRKLHRETVHLNRLAGAPAIYSMAGLYPKDYHQTRESVLVKLKSEVAQTFADFEQSGPVRQYWGRNKKKFENVSDMLQQRMSNTYTSYRKDIEGGVHAAPQQLKEKKIIGYPHYATSDLPFHALYYVYGQKKLEGLTEWRLRPRFQKNGYRLHPFPGKVFISLFTPVDMCKNRARHVAGKHNRKKLWLTSTVAHERETSIPGGVDVGQEFYEELVVIPSLRKYDPAYKDKFGIDERQFAMLQIGLAQQWSEEQGSEEMISARRKLKNKLIKDMLIPHKARQLLRRAQNEAKKRGGYLIYRHANGIYGLEPEGMRIPSQGRKFYSKKERDLLDAISQDRFGATSSTDMDIEDAISLKTSSTAFFRPNRNDTPLSSRRKRTISSVGRDEDCISSKKQKSMDGFDVNMAVTTQKLAQQDAATKFNVAGLQFQPIEKDGHCLYAAVSLYLGMDVSALRQQVAQTIRANIETYRAIIRGIEPNRTVEEYLDAIEETNEWADNLEIAVLMRVYKRPIIILDSPDGHIRNTSDCQPYQGKKPIFVYYNGHTHYDGLILNHSTEISGRDILTRLTAKQGEHVQSVEPSIEEHKRVLSSSKPEESDQQKGNGTTGEHSVLLREWSQRQERHESYPVAPNPQEENEENLDVNDWSSGEVSDAETSLNP